MSIDFAWLRQQITTELLLRWMAWSPTQRRGDQLRGLCPFCQQAKAEVSTASYRSPSCFSVNVRRNIFRCFRCKRSGNALELWALYRGIDIYPAACEIQNRLTLSAKSCIKQPTKASQTTAKQATAPTATPPNRLNS